jgi:SlyX protein
MSERQIELESKVAFLERTVDDLNDVVLAQSKSLEDLARRLALVESRQRASQEGEGPAGDPLEERPPHY